MSPYLTDMKLAATTHTTVILGPKAKTDVPVAGPGYVRSIISLNFVNDRFSGTQFDFKTSSVGRFTFDTNTQAFQSSPEGPLSWEAANDKVQLGEDSYWKIYAKYRHQRPNYVLLILIVGGEGAIALWARKPWAKLLQAQSVKAQHVTAQFEL